MGWSVFVLPNVILPERVNVRRVGQANRFGGGPAVAREGFHEEPEVGLRRDAVPRRPTVTAGDLVPPCHQRGAGTQCEPDGEADLRQPQPVTRKAGDLGRAESFPVAAA